MRGGDLADGPHTQETVDRMFQDIQRMIDLGNKWDDVPEPIPVNLPQIGV